ncbi:hypothetical protein [Geobacter sp. SVR]|uniref:hypothetical protein n=1 Tax=Geobacter sp. SVR TaxID=2495594 RepID=UPI00143EFC81|nr:hypothetical protein [Geobacter sp. SVR]BCS54521.1 hypothetical protein GSVR_28290 [Geobacter sp. SVR]GCF87121.1 hypothetical protein GSbR_37210 [Geobacter sp. SVR]
MSNQRERKDKSVSGQLVLLDREIETGSLEHLSLGIKQRLSKMLSPRDRFMVAAWISRVTGIEVKGSVFEKILGSDPAYQPTMVQVIAACKLAGAFDPLEFGLEELGAGVLTANEKPYVQLAKKIQERKQLEQEIALLESKCGVRR